MGKALLHLEHIPQGQAFTVVHYAGGVEAGGEGREGDEGYEHDGEGDGGLGGGRGADQEAGGHAEGRGEGQVAGEDFQYATLFPG